MTDERWSRLRRVFDAARDLPSDERAAFLERELKDEPTVRADVEQLLEAELGAEEFLAPSLADFAIPERIGPYLVGERLGEGGFGIVFRAEQTQPLRRSVALKLIKPGMDTKEVIARFEAERHALALMDHPAIARVFDAGETEAGRPYFVMELVDGPPITRFCDEGLLSIRERIQLFVEVCDAVHHAHQKGVIHRDLKPSNVLVGRRDGNPAPKVIDFGIAKATSVGLDTQSFTTHRGAVLGTLASMSPEQAGAIESVVDVRSDIYSLGVMLYELLAGAPPFDGKRLRSMTWPDAIRVIREEDPPRLTARLAGNEHRDAIAMRRRTESRALSRTLRGDLEWITQRAMEKEPSRRYASVSEFAADLRRHLAHETVLAGAPSRMYRLRKYIRRHRVGVAAAVFVLGAIFAGGIVAAVGFGRAIRAEREASREAEVSRRVSDFLVELFESSRPGASPGNTPGAAVTAKDLLDEGTRKIEEQLQEDPEIRAKLLTTMARSYLGLGEYDSGMQLLEKALGAAESKQPSDPKLVAYQLMALADGKTTTGENEGVVELLDRAWALASSAGRLEATWLARYNYRKANHLYWFGDVRLADSVVAQGIEFADAQAQTDSEIRTRLHQLEGEIALRRLDFDRAEGAFRLALELNAKEPRDPVLVVGNLAFLSNMFAIRGVADSALKYADEAIDVCRRDLPEDRLRWANANSAKARALVRSGKAEEAVVLYTKLVETIRAVGGNRSVLANQLGELADLYVSLGRFTDAIAAGSEAVEVCRGEYGNDRPVTGVALSRIALVHHQAGNATAAESCYVRAVDILGRTDPSNSQFPQALMNLGTLLRDARRLDRAEDLYRRAEAAFDSTAPGSRESLGMCLTNHGYTKSLQGQHDEAERLMVRGMVLRQGTRDVTWPGIGPGFVAWGAARALAGDRDGALEKLRLAAACGATLGLAQEYAELMAMRSDPDFPLREKK